MDHGTGLATVGEATSETIVRRYRETLAAGGGSILPSEAACIVAAEFGSDVRSVLAAVTADVGLPADAPGAPVVLVVDDHASIARMVARTLTSRTGSIGIVVDDGRPCLDVDGPEPARNDEDALSLAQVLFAGGRGGKGIRLPLEDEMPGTPFRDGDVLDRLFSDRPDHGLTVIRHRERGTDACDVVVLDERRDRPDWQSPYGPARAGRRTRGR